jgi:hypothetical protein
MQPEGIGDRFDHCHLERRVGAAGRGPRSIEQRGVIRHALQEPDRREVADRLGVLARQRERVRRAKADHIDANGRQCVGDRLAHGRVSRRDIGRGNARNDADRRVGHRSRFELSVEACDRHRARVDRTGGEERGGEKRDESGCGDDWPVSARSMQADPPRSKDRLHGARSLPGVAPYRTATNGIRSEVRFGSITCAPDRPWPIASPL